MKNSFETAFLYMYRNEVGEDYTGAESRRAYSNRRADRGGPTKYGISFKTLKAHRAPVPVSESDMQKLTIDEAKDIYYSKYWLTVGADKIVQLPVTIAIFDFAVLMGPYTSAINAQAAVNACMKAQGLSFLVKEDGQIGVKSAELLNQVDTNLFLEFFQALLHRKVTAIVFSYPDQIENEQGWRNRIERLNTLRVGPGRPMIS